MMLCYRCQKMSCQGKMDMNGIWEMWSSVQMTTGHFTSSLHLYCVLCPALQSCIVITKGLMQIDFEQITCFRTKQNGEST